MLRRRRPTGKALAPDTSSRLQLSGDAFDPETFVRELSDAKLGQLREAVEREARRRGSVGKTAKADAGKKPGPRRRKFGRRSRPRA